MSNSNETTAIPGASYGGALSSGWQSMKANFLAFLLIVLILSVLDLPLELAGGLSGAMHHDWEASNVLLQIFLTAYFFLLRPVCDYAADRLFLQGVRKIKVNVAEIIIGFKNYMNIVLANLLVFGLVGIAMVALIVPGIIVACRLVFTSYLVMDKGMDPIQAVETSWKLTRGHGWKIFGLGFTSIFIFILGLCLAFVGVLPAIMWIKASFASLYEAVLAEKNEDFFPGTEVA